MITESLEDTALFADRPLQVQGLYAAFVDLVDQPCRTAGTQIYLG